MGVSIVERYAYTCRLTSASVKEATAVALWGGTMLAPPIAVCACAALHATPSVMPMSVW